MYMIHSKFSIPILLVTCFKIIFASTMLYYKNRKYAHLYLSEPIVIYFQEVFQYTVDILILILLLLT